MSTRDKFEAAVNVIRSLPKSGSYQPSKDVMLRFYSYYKQATEGGCKAKKPAFWDVVGRAKWESWSSLGEMPAERAMEGYVAELQKIVETMSYTNNVAAFFDTVDDDMAPSISRDDLELVAGDIIRKMKSSSSSTESSRNDSPLHAIPEQNGHYDSDEEFVETEDSEIPTTLICENGFIPDSRSTSTFPVHRDIVQSERNDISARTLEEIKKTISCLEKDVNIMKEQLHHVQIVQNKRRNNKSILRMKPSWWPVSSITPAVLIILFLWPIVANRIYYSVRRRPKP